MRPSYLRLLLGAGAALALAVACTTLTWKADLIAPKDYATVDAKTPFIKVHTHRGEVYVLAEWRADEATRTVSGAGIRYSVERDVLESGPLEVPFDDAALIETNEPMRLRHTGLAVIGVVGGASLGMTAVCAANPKACFGSCPTFYTFNGQGEHLSAEGFSGSAARSLEATDLDALYDTVPVQGRLRVTMTNEALETHAVRSLRVLALPRTGGERVVNTGASFLRIDRPAPALTCRTAAASAADCLAPVLARDENEYTSQAGRTTLAEREEILLDFAAHSEHTGLLIGARRSLLSTFVMYQALAYMGLRASDWLEKLERQAQTGAPSFGVLSETLGRFDIAARRPGGPWLNVGSIREHGPIAKELFFFELPPALRGGPVQVRLDLTRGDWKLDYVAQARVLSSATPHVIQPAAVHRAGVDDPAARAALLREDDYLVTYPGDRFEVDFHLPDDGDYELFLESTGYYYEWIREQWLAEEDHREVARLLLDPGDALRRLAAPYARLEDGMEAIFWASRFGGGRP